MTIAELYETPAYAHRFFISANFEECQRRNLGRERVVPEDVMRRFHRAFISDCDVYQLHNEGWVVYNEASGDC